MSRYTLGKKFEKKAEKVLINSKNTLKVPLIIILIQPDPQQSQAQRNYKPNPPYLQLPDPNPPTVNRPGQTPL